MSRPAELSGNTGRIRVVAGILHDADDRILIAGREQSHSLKDHWEFPGGKVAGDETPEEALRRELIEELGIDVLEVSHFQHIEHDYPDLKVAIDFFLVAKWHGAPEGLEGQRIQWVEKASLDADELLPADAPVIAALKAL